MPVDEERRKRLDFGPIYSFADNTYLVRAGSDIRTMAEVDRPGVRVIGIANTTTIRSSARTLKNTKIAPAVSVDAALEMLNAGQADAFALTHDTLASLAPRVPGSRILDGSFRRVSFSIGVPKNRPEALASVTQVARRCESLGRRAQGVRCLGVQGRARSAALRGASRRPQARRALLSAIAQTVPATQGYKNAAT